MISLVISLARDLIMLFMFDAKKMNSIDANISAWVITHLDIDGHHAPVFDCLENYLGET